MRKLWHRLFGHGHTSVQFLATKPVGASTYCVCGYNYPKASFTTVTTTSAKTYKFDGITLVETTELDA